jgi:methionyl-tRNA formyltransferase
MRIVFMGTPDFAVSILDAVHSAGHEILACVTQPDRPKGRGHAVAMSAVKVRALELGIPVLQPVRVRKDNAFIEEIRDLSPDVIVVAAFGQILPKALLDIPRLGCINVHASLLPKYRGAAPIQWAVINGDRETGVTTMAMDVGLDTGDILEQKKVLLDPKETGGSLFDRLAAAGAELIVSTLAKAEKGTLDPVKQNDAEATHVGMLTKEMGDIDWSKDARSIECLIRGLNPWPTAYSFLADQQIRIFAADVLPDDPEPAGLPCGTVIAADRSGILVKTGSGCLRITELQPAGRRRMSADDYLRGHAVKRGDIFHSKG